MTTKTKTVSKTFKDEIETFESFDEMGLDENILRGIYAYGFETPSTIQKKAIVPVISGRDIIAQAQSGTGKTGTFTIGLLHRVDQKLQAPQVIVLAPTRVLAQQIKKVITDLSSFTEITIKVCIGGIRGTDTMSKGTQVKEQVIVGTPGRIYEYLEKGIIPRNDIKLVIMDEADEMLSKGFLDQIQAIYNFIPRSAQNGFFSATMPKEVFELAQELMNEPVELLVRTDQLTLEGIRQYYINLEKECNKFDTICDLYKNISITQCMIYCNSKKKVRELADQLAEVGHIVASMSGDIPQEERNKIMVDFRSGKSRILISTDMLARGIDVQQVSLVINYDLPLDMETYLHRIGRSGRFGRKGVGLNFCTNYDIEQLHAIEKFYSTEIQPLPSDLDSVFN